MNAKEYPRITIVSQCFNREKYIAETIESVISQGYPNLEYIVIDDGSTDKSWEIIQGYKDKLAYIEQREDGRNRTTPVPSINYGISKSTGEIFTTLNDKNLLLPKSLFMMAEIFTTFPDIEWVSGIGALANKEGIITNIMPIRKDLYEHLFFVPWNIQHEATFWRRSLWERSGFVGFDEEWPCAFDAELWCRFFGVGAKLWHLNTIVGAYRKIPTAHGSTRPQEYQNYAAKARERLRTQVPKRELTYARIYQGLRYLKPLLRNIPDNVYNRIPVLNHFSQDAITYYGINWEKDYLKRYRRNPFRTIYPW